LSWLWFVHFINAGTLHVGLHYSHPSQTDIGLRCYR